MPQVFNIAPRVLVYPHGTSPPAVEEGWLALPQLSATASAMTLGMAMPSPPAAAPVLGTVLPKHAVFGDGSHPTTRLCAAAVDLLCRQRPGMAVLDVGTGTGILARIARARGARFVVGTDIDPVAVACAKAHAALDSLGLRDRRQTDYATCMNVVDPGAGAADPGMGAAHPGTSAAAPSTGAAAPGMSAAAPGMHDALTAACFINIHFGDQAPDVWGACFDLVVANILEAPLRSLAPALCRALVPGGVLVISGFTRPQVPALRLIYETAGLQSAGDFSLDGWALLKFVGDHNFSR